MRAALLAIMLAAGIAAPAFADDPPDMVAVAKVRADAAPEALSRRTLGQVRCRPTARPSFAMCAPTTSGRN